MCLIIDTNIASRVLEDASDKDYGLLHRELFGARGRIVVHYGGSTLVREMRHNATVWKLLLALDQAGRARVLPNEQVDREQAAVEDLGICCSNDSHVIALARVGGARLLATRDGDLMTDFKNGQLIRPQRGKIYTRKAHQSLVRAKCR